ncbi:hypothetical protein GA0070616_4641 [Micromonospora nigra]|uniref:Uncharacterized protein n=1 Tax=Micromonospora nigra TaxID=145857 RepID=A0A1C6SU07_9ACTN|nr:hypothetical protein [Micromonospora nigra]SCL33124.1 hypothetical protein GA0070616_4641 [Micromonospora nigra]
MSLMHKLTTFLRSPKGQQLVDRGRRELAKPANQQKLRGLKAKLSKRR